MDEDLFEEDLKKKLGLLNNPKLRKYDKFPVYQESPDPLPQTKYRALGLTSGVGSMLIGARNAGFGVVGNVEWRDYYRLIDVDGRNTFVDNFAGSFMARGFDDMDPIQAHDLEGSIDIALGHPECGKYSRLNSVHKFAAERKHDSSDLPLFLEYVARIRPRYFVMDDLPQSFIALPMRRYHELLPDYDLFPEWVSNYHYGNPQKHRNRMFMLGSLRSEKWAFVPGEKREHNSWTVLARIGDIEEKYYSLPNHDRPDMEGGTSRFTNMRWRGDHPTWYEIQDYFKNHQEEGEKFEYHASDGTKKVRISLIKVRYDHPSPVLNGGIPQLHAKTALPFSIRERARIQGFPDDFVFYGTKLNDKGEWDHDANLTMVKQTGKAMPVEFNTYVSKQIMAHIEGKRWKASNERLLVHNPYVSTAKQWWCREVGYANQEAACRSCWLTRNCTLPRRSIGAVPFDVEDLLK